MRAITTDAQGREILVGLSLDETTTYLKLSRDLLTADGGDTDDSDTYLTLHDKHERARLEVLGVEHIVRTENPPRH